MARPEEGPHGEAWSLHGGGGGGGECSSWNRGPPQELERSSSFAAPPSTQHPPPTHRPQLPRPPRQDQHEERRYCGSLDHSLDPPRKRPRSHQGNIFAPPPDGGYSMDVEQPEESSALSFAAAPCPSPAPIVLPHPDDVLIDMVRSSSVGILAQQNHRPVEAEVVNFCRSSGIPLSRMLQLDLLGLVGRTAGMPNATIGASTTTARATTTSAAPVSAVAPPSNGIHPALLPTHRHN